MSFDERSQRTGRDIVTLNMLWASVLLALSLGPATNAFAPQRREPQRRAPQRHAPTLVVRGQRGFAPVRSSNNNVDQTVDTSRDKVMTFSYDMSLEPKYEKPTYPGTGNGLSGDDGDYDVIVIGSGMGGLACGALSAKYGEKVLVLESHIKCGGSAHTFSRMHKGGQYSFEVGPSIFEGRYRRRESEAALGKERARGSRDQTSTAKRWPDRPSRLTRHSRLRSRRRRDRRPTSFCSTISPAPLHVLLLLLSRQALTVHR